MERSHSDNSVHAPDVTILGHRRCGTQSVRGLELEDLRVVRGEFVFKPLIIGKIWFWEQDKDARPWYSYAPFELPGVFPLLESRKILRNCETITEFIDAVEVLERIQ